MSDVSRTLTDRARRRLSWGAPVAVAAAVAAGITLTTAASSSAAPSLPKRSAAQLLVDAQTRGATALSGVVHESAALGLPSLPGSDRSAASLSWQTFLSGSHNAKVWIDGPDRQRAALLGELSEAEVVHNGTNVWTYTSDSNTATHTVLAEGGHAYPAAHGQEAHGRAMRAEETPATVAAALLKAVKPSTVVSVDTATKVAGRSAYTLVLRPRDTRSTVHKVTIALDAAKHVPLQVQVFGKSSTPAFSIGFSQVSFARPAASTFRFTVPKGATVSTNPVASDGHQRWHGDHHALKPGKPRTVTSWGKKASSTRPHMPFGLQRAGTKVIGSGWTSVVEVPAGSSLNGLGGGLLQEATTALPNGGRLLHTALINAVLLPDGRIFAGAVTPAALEHIAATIK